MTVPPERLRATQIYATSQPYLAPRRRGRPIPPVPIVPKFPSIPNSRTATPSGAATPHHSPTYFPPSPSTALSLKRASGIVLDPLAAPAKRVFRPDRWRGSSIG